MIKQIKIGKDQQLTLDSSAGWLLIYNEQFGRDVLPDLLPLLGAGLELVAGIFDGYDEINDENFSEILDARKDEIVAELAGMESSMIIRIVWAMAKNADDTIETPLPWVKQFSSFPLDTIGTEVFSMLAESFVSAKNLKRLRTAKQKAKIKLSGSKISLSAQSLAGSASKA